MSNQKTVKSKLVVAEKQREQAKKDKEYENYKKYCLDKVPTQRQFDLYKKDWLIEKYGNPVEIKPSKIKS